jgi:N-acyl homoserine lactone hydrolase
VILSGDAAHFKANFDNRRVPSFNFDQEQSVASMNRTADIMAKEHAQPWINHDKCKATRRKRRRNSMTDR